MHGDEEATTILTSNTSQHLIRQQLKSPLYLIISSRPRMDLISALDFDRYVVYHIKENEDILNLYSITQIISRSSGRTLINHLT